MALSTSIIVSCTTEDFWELDCDVTRPRINDWTDKFIVRTGTRGVVECKDDIAGMQCGVWPVDHVSAISWDNIPSTSVLKENCRKIYYTDNDYEYCDLDNVHMSICSGAEVNEYFISDLGYFGQDCESWHLLSELLAGELTVPDIQKVCIELA
jgi:hypothetical protein